jgi:hypothetical protein
VHASFGLEAALFACELSVSWIVHRSVCSPMAKKYKNPKERREARLLSKTRYYWRYVSMKKTYFQSFTRISDMLNPSAGLLETAGSFVKIQVYLLCVHLILISTYLNLYF